MNSRPGIASALVSLVSFVSFGALAACRSPTQITVQVQTDVPCADVSATSFTSGELGAVETAAPTTESTACAGAHLGTVVLVPSGSESAEVGFKVVTALNRESLDKCASAAAANDANCIVARRQLRYLPHTPLTVIVNMTAQCEGQVCDANSTCVNGVCENAAVDPTQCEGSGCDESALTPESADGGFDATVGDATTDSPQGSETGVPEASAPDAAAGVPGCDLAGLQAGSPWPMEGYCPSGRYRSPLVGPATRPGHKWTWKGAGPEASPSVGADGTLYVASAAGFVTALNPSDGGVLWTYSPNGDASVYATLPVIAADDTLRFFDYANSAYVVLGLDASARTPVTIDFAGRNSLTLVGDGTLYFADDSANLIAMTGAGVIEWSIPQAVTAFPVVGTDGTIISSTSSLGGSANFSAVTASHPDGGPAWSVMVDGGLFTTNAAVAVDGTVRVGAMGIANSAPGLLYKIDRSGGVAWSKVVDDGGINGIAVADDGTTYVSGVNGLTSWDSNGTQTAHSTYTCDAPTIDQGGALYAVCYYGLLTSFGPGLDFRWQFPIPSYLGDVLDAVIIGSGNTLYVATTDGSGNAAIDAFGPP